jgi:hypothetical protein
LEAKGSPATASITSKVTGPSGSEEDRKMRRRVIPTALDLLLVLALAARRLKSR